MKHETSEPGRPGGVKTRASASRHRYGVLGQSQVSSVPVPPADLLVTIQSSDPRDEGAAGSGAGLLHAGRGIVA